MCIAVIPLSLATSAAAEAARIAAYGEDSILSAFTNIPPDVLDMVSAPEMSVIWIKVLLYELNIWTTAHFSFFLLAPLTVLPPFELLMSSRLSLRQILFGA
jgi:hypothetical protein